MQKFPKQIYVRWEGSVGWEDSEEPFLAADETPNGEDGEKIAVYELKEVMTMKIVESLV